MLSIPFPTLDPTAFTLGPVAVRWYGLAYVAGLVLGWLYIRGLLARLDLWAAGRPPLRSADADDLFLWTALGVIIGGRVGHVLLYEPSYYLSRPLEVFMVWNGGMSFHGGLLGTGVALAAFARLKGAPMLSIMDVVAAAAPLGLLFGRLANFINGEIVGSVTSMPWGMVFPGWGPEPRHPAMLYEAALEGIALFLLLRRITHSGLALRMPGLTTGWFLIGYGVFRIFCELFKIVDYRLLVPGVPITKGMVYSLPLLLIGIAFVVKVRRQTPTGAGGSRIGSG